MSEANARRYSGSGSSVCSSKLAIRKLMLSYQKSEDAPKLVSYFLDQDTGGHPRGK